VISEDLLLISERLEMNGKHYDDEVDDACFMSLNSAALKTSRLTILT